MNTTVVLLTDLLTEVSQSEEILTETPTIVTHKTDIKLAGIELVELPVLLPIQTDFEIVIETSKKAPLMPLMETPINTLLVPVIDASLGFTLLYEDGGLVQFEKGGYLLHA